MMRMRLMVLRILMNMNTDRENDDEEKVDDTDDIDGFWSYE